MPVSIKQSISKPSVFWKKQIRPQYPERRRGYIRERKSSVAKLRGVGIPEYSHKYRNFLKMRGRDNGKIITFARNKGDDPY